MKLLFKVCVAGLLALLSWEVILSNFVVNSTGYQEHEVLGRISKEGMYLQGEEGFTRTQINSIGLRGSEIPTKQKGEFRILALGDSFTEAFQVNDNETYTNILEKKLQSKSDSTEMVINGGRSGTSPAHYIHWADFFKKEIHQDYTIIQLSDLDFTDDLLNSSRQFYLLENENKFTVKVNENFSSSNSLLQKYPQFTELLEVSVVRAGAGKAQQILAKDSIKEEESSTITVADTEKYNYQKLVKWTLDELKKNYPNVVIVYLPSLKYDNLSTEPSELENLTELYAKENDIGFINMRDGFLDYYIKYNQPAHGFNNTTPGKGHLNSEGHKLVANKLTEYFSGSVFK